MTLAELNDLLRHQRQVAHVSQTHVSGLLFFVTPSLTFNYRVSDMASLKKIERQKSIVAPVHRSIEDLLDNIVNNIVKEVVPWEAEEEALFTIRVHSAVKRFRLPKS